MVIELVRQLERGDQGTFPEVPFVVECEIAELTIQIDVTAPVNSRATVDLGLRDPVSVRGWSGGARKEIVIGETQATPGYVPGALTAGTWAVLLGAYEVPEAGCTASIKISIQPKAATWVKGDLHGHSVHSDGSYTIAEIEQLVQTAGLDFMGLTDHNTWRQNQVYPRDSNVVFIPGIELTTYRGHCNLYGVERPIDDFRATEQETVKQYLAIAKARGAYLSLNHPFDYSCPSCYWQWGLDLPFDWVEVWNGPWRESNQAAVQWWHEQLVNGRRLVAVGGSDTHRPHPYVKHGMPTNWVLTASKTSQAILQAIALGHVFVSYAPSGPSIELTCGSYMMGDAVLTSDEAPVHLTVTTTEVGDVIRVISDLGVEQELVADGNRVDCSFPQPRCRFVRVEVYRHFDVVDQTLLAALCNPIYFEIQ